MEINICVLRTDMNPYQHNRPVRHDSKMAHHKLCSHILLNIKAFTTEFRCLMMLCYLRFTYASSAILISANAMAFIVAEQILACHIPVINVSISLCP
jgi:hypothetical protein